MEKKFRPTPVVRIVCPNCGELMVKFYPNTTLVFEQGSKIPWCKKCLANHSLKSRVA